MPSRPCGHWTPTIDKIWVHPIILSFLATASKPSVDDDQLSGFWITPLPLMRGGQAINSVLLEPSRHFGDCYVTTTTTTTTTTTDYYYLLLLLLLLLLATTTARTTTTTTNY